MWLSCGVCEEEMGKREPVGSRTEPEARVMMKLCDAGGIRLSARTRLGLA